MSGESSYSTILNFINCLGVPTSSPGHRNITRTNAGLAVLNQVIQSGQSITNTSNPIGLIPIAFAQTLTSGSAVVRTDTHLHEKFTQLTQAIFAAIILVLATFLLFHDEDTIKTLMYLFQLLYSAILLVTWVPSEMSKDQTTSTATGTTLATKLKTLVKGRAEPDQDEEMAITESEEEEDDENTKRSNSSHS